MEERKKRGREGGGGGDGGRAAAAEVIEFPKVNANEPWVHEMWRLLSKIILKSTEFENTKFKLSKAKEKETTLYN